MDRTTGSQTFEDKLIAANHIDPRPEFLSNLRIRLAQQTPHKPSFAEQVRMIFRRPAWVTTTLVVILMAMGVIAVGPQRVEAVFNQLLGYISGIGFVENAENSRVLSEPVSVTRDGVTLTVEDAAIDAAYTHINIRVTGLDLNNDLARQGSDISSGQRRLALPDGTNAVLESYRVEVDGDALVIKMLYSPLPENVMGATLLLDQIPGVSAGFPLENWQIPMQFQSGQADSRILAATQVDLPSQEQQGITMILKNVAQTPNMDIFNVKLVTNDPAVNVEGDWSQSLSLIDTNGHRIPISGTYDLNGSSSYTFQTQHLETGPGYTLGLSGTFTVFRKASANETRNHFFVDLGSNPEIDQSWVMDQTLEAAGHSIHLSSAHLLAGNACGPTGGSNDMGIMSLAFSFDPEPGTLDIMVFPINETLRASRVYLKSCIVYPEMPSGRNEFEITGVTEAIEGDWQISWQSLVEK